MVKEIKNFDSLKKEAFEVQYIYSVFSKFDHNGSFTFDLLHNPFDSQGGLKMKYMIKCAVDSCVIALRTMCKHWIEDDSLLSKRIDLSLRNLLNL